MTGNTLKADADKLDKAISGAESAVVTSLDSDTSAAEVNITSIKWKQDNSDSTTSLKTFPNAAFTSR